MAIHRDTLGHLKAVTCEDRRDQLPSLSGIRRKFVTCVTEAFTSLEGNFQNWNRLSR
jgi:hypothetical protein